jgi:HPt (histidine-containing phosphotransfer) domain-containing protein
VIANLETQIGADTVALLVDDFAASADEAVAQIAQARASGDLVVWTRAAHSLKSAAANMGLARVFQLAAAIEAAGDKGDRSTMEAPSDRLAQASQEGVAALRARYTVAAGEETVN